MATTIETARVTEPAVYPHKPKAMAAGRRFGINDITPSFTLRRTSRITPDIKINASVVP